MFAIYMLVQISTKTKIKSNYKVILHCNVHVYRCLFSMMQFNCHVSLEYFQADFLITLTFYKSVVKHYNFVL